MERVKSDRRAVVTLPGDLEILIEREFDAPRAAVWRAWTEPALIRRWWHANRGEMTVCEVDLRVGGAWRYVMIAASHGFEVAFHGVFSEVEAAERLVGTQVYESIPDASCTVTTTFEDLAGGGTVMRMHVLHENKANRDGHLGSGMEEGMRVSLELLDVAASEAAPSQR
jgi:uncharacterized protein YndB with AHSA1/START domain